MAKPLDYTPTAPPGYTAHDELEDLLQTLHTSGTLRVLNGFFGQFAEVSEVAVNHLDTPGGRNALSNLLILAKGLTEINPEQLQAFVAGAEKGLGAARQSLHDEPPSLLGLFGMLKDPEVRRGLTAVFVLLHTLGKHLREQDAVQAVMKHS